MKYIKAFFIIATFQASKDTNWISQNTGLVLSAFLWAGIIMGSAGVFIIYNWIRFSFFY